MYWCQLNISFRLQSLMDYLHSTKVSIIVVMNNLESSSIYTVDKTENAKNCNTAALHDN